MKAPASFILVIWISFMAISAPAQILDIRRAVKNKIVNKVNNNIDKAIDKQVDKVEEAVVDSITKRNKETVGAITAADSLAKAASEIYLASLSDIRTKLITEGKLVSYSIYFDSNSDLVKPESYPALQGIAVVLAENPAVRVRIVGHTDSDGIDAANLALSKRRAASVKNELSKNFGVDASRMETDGKGGNQPVAPNDSPANKALNLRIEFIKL
jgi:outer membrane protein OmpA-like peptidoglycan-associated protein